jgi:hypothetical protein
MRTKSADWKLFSRHLLFYDACYTCIDDYYLSLFYIAILYM